MGIKDHRPAFEPNCAPFAFTGPMMAFSNWFGLTSSRPSFTEIALSGVGGLVAISLILVVSTRVLANPAGALIVASMGASAALIFAVPHGPLSQPWPLVGGHLISALIGIGCHRWLGDGIVTAGLAVGLAISAMHTLRCIHPPGGATALTAALGGPAMDSLGYQFLLTPVALNLAVILAVGILFNLPFDWRRYPAALAQPSQPPDSDLQPPLLSQSDLIAALNQLDTFVDVSEQDLLKIYAIAEQHKQASRDTLTAIQVGQCFSNGRYGNEWQIREVTEIRQDATDGRQIVAYRVLAGPRRRHSFRCGLLEFQRWAAYRVERNENSWQQAN